MLKKEVFLPKVSTLARMRKKIEIMAPAGSFESLNAAIQAGADAVYFGVGNLNMRARSTVNFTIEDLEQITTLCQQHQVRTYLTVNTIIYPEETTAVSELLTAAKKAGVSAIIASDWAVISEAQKLGLKLHVSTQCNITNLEAVRFYARYADVMVTARELNLKQVEEIVDGIRREQIIGPSGEMVKIEVCQ